MGFVSNFGCLIDSFSIASAVAICNLSPFSTSKRLVAKYFPSISLEKSGTVIPHFQTLII